MNNPLRTDNAIEYRIEKLLRGKSLFTPKELVRMGLYGSGKSVLRAIRTGELMAVWISEQRVVIFKESIIAHLIKMTSKKNNRNVANDK